MSSGRREPRIVVNREFDSIDDFVHEYVTNLSRTGAFIRTETPLPVGTRVLLEFSVIADELEIVKGEGEVVRVVAPGGTAVAGMGVVFVRLTTVSRRFVEALLSRRAPPPRPPPRATQSPTQSPPQSPRSPGSRGSRKGS